MLVYRLSPHSFSGDLAGEGNRLHGGRWNPKGIPAIYTCEHPAVTLLEVLVHVNKISLLPAYDLVTIEVPDSLKMFMPALTDLPADWQTQPVPSSTIAFGQDWLVKSVYPLLRVPSVIMYPFSSNILINPRHPDVQGKLRIADITPWKFDARLKP